MTEAEIKKLYKQMRKRYSNNRYYYKKKYGIELNMPKLVKRPTEKTIKAFSHQIAKQAEVAKKKVVKFKDQQKKEEAKKKKAKQTHVPKLEDILLERIKQIIQEGAESDNKFEQYKADRVDELLKENLPSNKEERRNKLSSWLKALPKLDDAIQQFIFDSKQTDQPTKAHSVYLWNYISSVILGTKTSFNEEYEEE